jgi:hypothetical protein
MDNSLSYTGLCVLKKGALICGLLAAIACRGEDQFSFESAGARYGIGASHSSADFHQAEAFVDWNLPWTGHFGTNWILQPRLDASAGWLGGNDTQGGVFTAGALVAFGNAHFPVWIEGGSGPTVLTRSVFGSKDMGELFQFTSHIGLYWDFLSHFRLGYRYQHTSDAGLSDHNPGLNMQLVTLSYRF